MFGIKERQQKKENERRRLQQEKEFKERALINKTLRSLKGAVEKYENQKQILIQLAREAEVRGLKPQYNMAASGLKIIIDSQDKANAMYLNLTITNQIKSMGKVTEEFVNAMSTVSKELSEIESSVDFTQAQYDYSCAMNNIAAVEEKLRDFTDNIYDSIETYAESSMPDERIDKAIDMLIHNTTTNLGSNVQSTVGEDNSAIDLKIRELENMLNGCK